MAVPIRQGFSILLSTSGPGIPRVVPGPATAGRTLALAERTHDAQSRGGAFLRAHTYFRTAEFLLSPSDPKRSIATERTLSAFYNGLVTLWALNTNGWKPPIAAVTACP